MKRPADYARLSEDAFPHVVTVHRTPDSLWIATCSTCPAASTATALLSEAVDQIVVQTPTVRRAA